MTYKSVVQFVSKIKMFFKVQIIANFYVAEYINILVDHH